MFDFSWSQIMLIGVVALVLIGPKDLPIALRAVSNMVKKARAMAAEFHTHVDDLMKDADLKGVRDQFKDIRNFDIRSEIEKAVDPDRSIRDTFASNPLDPMTDTSASSDADATLEAVQSQESSAPVVPPPDPTRAYAPPFIPPSLVEPRADLAALADIPAFVPPGSIRPPPPPPADPDILPPASVDAASVGSDAVTTEAVAAPEIPPGSVDAGRPPPVSAQPAASDPGAVAPGDPEAVPAASGERQPAGAAQPAGAVRPTDHPT